MRLVETLAAGFTGLNLVLIGTFAPGGPEVAIQAIGASTPILTHAIHSWREVAVEDVNEVAG